MKLGVVLLAAEASSRMGRAAGGKRRGSTRPPAWIGARMAVPERAARDSPERAPRATAGGG